MDSHLRQLAAALMTNCIEWKDGVLNVDQEVIGGLIGGTVYLKWLFAAAHLTSPVIVDSISFAGKGEQSGLKD